MSTLSLIGGVAVVASDINNIDELESQILHGLCSFLDEEMMLTGYHDDPFHGLEQSDIVHQLDGSYDTSLTEPAVLIELHTNLGNFRMTVLILSQVIQVARIVDWNDWRMDCNEWDGDES